VKQTSLPRVVTEPTQAATGEDDRVPYQSSKQIGLSDMNKK
jgi:hypothetical protein